ncbi:MAG: hypothetical protein ACRENK_08750 [Gemmatimonadaceae bacterium]
MTIAKFIKLPSLSVIAWLSVAAPSRGHLPPALPGHVVDIVAGNYYLQAPDTIASGLTTLRLRVAQGDHMAILVRLDSGHTATDLLRARREGHPRPPWMHFVGGPGFPRPGATVNATMVLEPGQYVLLCDVTDPDGVAHFEKGMFRSLVVRPAQTNTRRAASLPPADVVVHMRDYTFVFSPEIRAGTRVLRVVNDGTVMHEFRLVHVLPGHTGRESIAWKPGDKSARPDEDVTAVLGIPPGAELTTTVSFVRGEYGVFCVPQLSHGMIQVLRIAN